MTHEETAETAELVAPWQKAFKTILALALAAGCVSLRAQAPPAPLQRFFADYWEDRLRESPELATQVGRTEYNHLWTDASKPAREAAQARRLRYLEQIRSFDARSLSATDRLSLELLRHQVQEELDGVQLDRYLAGVSQLDQGIHNIVFATIDLMPARTPKDYDNIIARLDATPAYVDQNIQVIQDAIALGIVQPRIVVDLVVEQLDAQLKQDAQHTPLLAAFRSLPGTMSAADQDRLRQRATAAYADRFAPAWRKLRGFLADTYAPKSRPSVAVSSLPGGASRYAFLVARETTTRMMPDEIYKLGLAEVPRIENEMQGILSEVGFSGTIEAFESKLQAMPEMRFASKEEMLVFCRNAAMIVEPNLPQLFKRLPRMPFGIRAIPEDREATSPSNYQSPAADGTRAGFVNINTYRAETQLKYDKEALILHEGVPGHHLQRGLQGEIEALPEFRKHMGFVAYTEGWGLYAESLGGQLGLYRDPYSRFGQLASERFRAARLVIDTGLHAFGWTRQRALDYLRVHAPTQSPAEIDRYIARPAQALGYKLGELKIKELRRRVEAALGPRFDIREFHDVVLRNGTLPLDLLEQQVEAYIAVSR